MHSTCIDMVSLLPRNFMKKDNSYSILDVGSLDLNGTLKPMFTNPLWTYQGLDMAAGPNVDIIANSCYDYPIESNTYDIVVTANVAEHIEDIYAWSEELYRIVKPEGLLCVHSLTYWQEHKYPVDCWRFLPDGFMFLFVKRLKSTFIELYTDKRELVIIVQKPKKAK
jgi:SAM-dependent methyltransferase